MNRWLINTFFILGSIYFAINLLGMIATKAFAYNGAPVYVIIDGVTANASFGLNELPVKLKKTW